MRWITVILLIVTGLACQAVGNETGKRPAERGRLVSAEAKEKVTASELRETYNQLTTYIRNGYTAYRITYNTTSNDGREIVASGAIFVPDTQAPLPMFNYNHGTYFPSQEKEAPSYLGYSYELIMGKLFSSAGYLVVMPDYPGYGASKNIDHPYGAYYEIAVSVIDMLRAVKEFCIKQGITLSGKYFYSGWSEGAAVALATVKLLEQDYKGEFTPTASVLNAGPYYTSGFVNHILNAEGPLTYMNTYVWVLQSYNTLYHINKPLSYYFREPAATLLQDGPETRIPRDPQQLFTQTFRENYNNGKDSTLQKAFLKNDLWDWKPASKIIFCHGDRDDYVPLFNSEKAYNAMKEKGADVTLQVFKGHTHSSGVLNFVRTAFTYFENAR